MTRGATHRFRLRYVLIGGDWMEAYRYVPGGSTIPRNTRHSGAGSLKPHAGKCHGLTWSTAWQKPRIVDAEQSTMTTAATNRRFSRSAPVRAVGTRS